ncbi:MAG: crosslink repair DNA glycosylase YcaQ family protein [Nocardioides sp.]
MTHELSRADARRIALHAQLLTAPRPDDVFETVRQLAVVQIDPTNAIAPSADLVLWSRIGSAYDPADLREECDTLALVEHLSYLRPAEDMVLYRAEMEVWPGVGQLKEWHEQLRDWVADNNACRMDILERLRADGPLLMRDLPDTCVRPWRSKGWNNNKNVDRLLHQMVQRGEVAVAGRGGKGGRERLFDLASRIYPDDDPVTFEESLVLLNERRLRSVGIARPKAALVQGEPIDVGDAGEPAVIDGVKGVWRVDPTLLDMEFTGRTALLSPFDRLIHDRKRMADLFEFEYALEMFKPVEKRRWGYYALPILVGDRLVGKLDAAADRKGGVLRVAAIHEDEPFDAEATASVHAEIEDLARWLDLELEWHRA